MNELETLVDAEQPDSAAWLNGEGFINVRSGGCWSSTTYDGNKDYAWFIDMRYGNAGNDKKVIGNCVMAGTRRTRAIAGDGADKML